MKINELQIGKAFTSETWFKIDQEKINFFASATGDSQWIHVDVQRSKSESPFKNTIAHGFLTVSLVPMALSSILEIDAKKQTLINYGINSLRFLQPVLVGSEIQFLFQLKNKERKSNGLLFTFEIKTVIKGHEKPAMVCESLMLLVE